MHSIEAGGRKPISSHFKDDENSTSSSSVRRSTSRSALQSKDSQVPPVPSFPIPYPSSSSGLVSSKSFPSLPKYSAPLKDLQTRPEEFTLSVRKREEPKVLQKTEKGKGRQSKGSRDSAAKESLLFRELTKEDQLILEELASEAILDDDEESYMVGASIASPGKPRKPSSPKKSPKRGPAPPSIHRGNQVVSETDTAIASASRFKSGGINLLRSKLGLSRPLQLAGLMLPLLTISGSYGSYWASQKRNLGFCDTDATANRAVVHHRMQSLLSPKPYTSNPTIDKFVKDATTALTPESCEICPTHAICADGEVKACAKDYILQPSVLAFLFSNGLSPRQSVMPLLFKPSCQPDTERLVRVAETASQIAAYLRDRKGDIICSGEEKARSQAARKSKNGKAEDWAVYGTSEDWLKKVTAEQRNVRGQVCNVRSLC